LILFTVYGESVAQDRSRATTINGQVRMYDPKKSIEFKDYVKLVASEHHPEQLLEGPLYLEVIIFKPTLKSFSKKKKTAAERGEIRPTTKPDVDNYVKSIKDACNKVIWKGDSQIVDLHFLEFYSENPRVEVSVVPFNNVQNISHSKSS